MQATARFATWLAGLRYSDLPEATVASAKEKLIDYLGVTIGGVRQGPLYATLLADRAGKKFSGPCTVIGTRIKTTAADAAWLNGVSGHSLDMDDGHRRGQGHPGVVVIPAALAVAEALGRNGRDFLAALVAGYEVFARVGAACHPGTVNRGFHTTGVVGCLAAAAAAASLYRASGKEMGSALGSAGLLSGGLMIVNRSGTTLKPLNAGRAASNGVFAAQLAHMGAEGAPDILEGKDGFFQTFSGQDINYDILLGNLGDTFELDGAYVKFYPACRHAHAPIDAALALKPQVDIDAIRDICITAYPTAMRWTRKETLPEDISGSRFNMGFAVALAFVQGHVGMDDFCPEKARLPKVKELFGKIRFEEDPAYESRERGVRGAAIAITTDKGTLRKEVLLPVGEPENPAPKAAFMRKFADCAGGFWTPKQEKTIFSLIEHIETLEDVGEFARALRAPKARRKA